MRNAFVAGCSVGLGRATALRLSEDGWHVFAGVRRPARDGAAVSRRARRHCDLGHRARVAEIVGDAGLHALVNNAGFAANVPVEFASERDFAMQLGVNLWARFD
jgi:NAD(P)-dependent dehydrogenase (short-subunit alcohol dehydrogenase family)